MRVWLVIALLATGASAHAQWLKYPTTGVPRTADGKPNLSAPAPRAADGKPDLSGIWQLEPPPCAPGGCGDYSAGVNYGRLEVAVTVDDPKAYTQPWTVTLVQRIVLDTELLDYHCLDNEKDAGRLLGK